MRRPRVVVLLLAALSAVAALGVTVSGAFGASVTSAKFTGTPGTVVKNGAVYAKEGQLVTLTVNTDASKCVEVTGAHSATQSSSSDKTVWTFEFTAPKGDAVQSVTAKALRNLNPQGKCVADSGEKAGTQNASYFVDNTGPAITGALAPAANGSGWNNSNVAIAWTATDPSSDSIVVTPAADSVNTDTGSVEKTATAKDALGNEATGTVTVKLDKTLPSIDATRVPAPNANNWNNTDVSVSFTCSDALSGIKSCTGGGTRTVSTEGANQSAPGVAVDNADNRNDAGVTGISIDKTKPALSGAAVEQPNADGWHGGDVTVRWTAADALSGLDGVKPADTKLTGEGEGLALTETVKDKAGNATTATSAAVKIDRTAPATGATAPSGWSKGDVSVTLVPNDALSGVKSTSYKVDGGAVQSGTAVVIRGEGKHTLEFWSTDKAGNVEAHKTVAVNIDGTAPAIRHELSRTANANGWFRENVDVDFICDDAASGIASCGPDKLVAEEARNQDIAGTAVDNAGNTAEDHAFVSLDKTAPGVTASADRAANAAGWYSADVTVSFSATDELSGVDSVSAAGIVGEGREQSASGTARDAAGNERSVQLTGINVDKTAPALSGSPKSEPNAAGWYSDDVVVGWTASDALSGLAGTAPADSTIKGEGDNLSVSRTVSDVAGNTISKTVGAIKIDRTAPTTTIEVPEALASGWYAKAFDVTLTGTDALSKVAKTFYSVDGGPAKDYDGAFQFGQPGVHTITFWSVDNAGNVESKDAADHTITVKIDDIAPTITGARYPAANAFGWNNTDVDVRFECRDDESGIPSGVAGCDPGTTFTSDVLSGSGHEYTGVATDNAGNKSSATVGGIKIDKTLPTLTGAATTRANAAGWYNGDVTVKWTGSDALSGIDPATQPADTVVTGEGAALVAGPATIADKAGNVSTPANVTLKVDRTAPVIDGKPSTSPASDAAGWYRGAVKVDFTCTDNLSGCAGGVDSKVLSTDGANQSVKSETIEDLAGNVGAAKTVDGINIDSKAPQSAADNKCEGSNGWCRTKATVVLTAEDQAGLSGVKELRYSINGGPEKSAAGARTEVEVPLMAKSGMANVAFYAVDHAGNIERGNGVALKFDNIAPSVKNTVNPLANAAGWNSANLIVHFDATDDDGGSGVDTASVTPDVSVTENTLPTGRVVQGQADDLAGNRGTDSVTVKLDKTAPTITGAVVAGTKGANGWYTSEVTVRFTCADGLSGVATCDKDVVLNDNGAGQSVTGKVVDTAGNEATFKVEGINIDRSAPTIAMSGVTSGEKFLLGTTPNIGCTAKDNLSTTVTCAVKVTGGNSNGTGMFTYTATATDEAGNVASVTGTYSVIYRWDGFRQPINDTAHQVGTTTSIFKGGSTVPAKFQLKKADGTIVQATTAPLWLTPAKGSPTTAPIVESVYTDSATSGMTFRYDAADSQYHYNWASPKSGTGFYHRIGVRLDDGETYFVNIGLR